MLIEKFIDYLQIEKNYSSNTLSAYKKDLVEFKNFINEKELNEIRVHWSFLYKDYPNALDMFEVIAPVRIISSQKIDHNSSMINLYFINQAKLMNWQRWLKN